MGRFLCDTNIATFMLMGFEGEISTVVHDIIEGYDNQLYISSVSIMELAHLYWAKKIDSSKKRKYPTFEDMVYTLEDKFGLQIKHFGREHALSLGKLTRRHDHNDPVDHAIIAHTMTEKLTLISSDKKFGFYRKQGLEFVFNDRWS